MNSGWLHSNPMMQCLSAETKFHTICQILVNCVNDHFSIFSKGEISPYNDTFKRGSGAQPATWPMCTDHLYIQSEPGH